MFSLLKQSINRFNYEKRSIHTTCCLLAEPLKRKKRIDPLLLRKREERKIRKLEKEIKILEKSQKQLKPILELHLKPQIIKELAQRQREPQEVDSEANQELQRLSKLWSIYKCEQRLAELDSIKSIVRSQKRALDALREESEELYSSAISIDQKLMPFKSAFVKKESPKVDGYVAPDGRQTDVTKQWTM